jgi:hypothetical protein
LLAGQYLTGYAKCFYLPEFLWVFRGYLILISQNAETF